MVNRQSVLGQAVVILNRLDRATEFPELALAAGLVLEQLEANRPLALVAAVLARKQQIGESAPALWELAKSIIAQSAQLGLYE